jgi:hypothetical protein
MTRLWTPPQVPREQVEQRRDFERDLQSKMVRAEMVRVKSVLDEFNYELRRIDPLLELVRAGENTRGTPMKAGYYHVIRWNEGAPPSVLVVEGPDGEFVEPSARVFESLKRNDLWDPRNERLRRQRERLAEQAAERLKLREREERQEEMVDRWLAGHRTFVSLDRSVPWSQNHAGRRGAKRPS